MGSKVQNFIEKHTKPNVIFTDFRTGLLGFHGYIVKTKSPDGRFFTQIYYNSTDSLEKQLKTITHEYGHYLSLGAGTYIIGGQHDRFNDEEDAERLGDLSYISAETLEGDIRSGNYDSEYTLADHYGLTVDDLVNLAKRYRLMGFNIPISL